MVMVAGMEPNFTSVY